MDQSLLHLAHLTAFSHFTALPRHIFAHPHQAMYGPRTYWTLTDSAKLSKKRIREDASNGPAHANAQSGSLPGSPVTNLSGTVYVRIHKDTDHAHTQSARYRLSRVCLAQATSRIDTDLPSSFKVVQSSSAPVPPWALSACRRPLPICRAETGDAFAAYSYFPFHPSAPVGKARRLSPFEDQRPPSSRLPKRRWKEVDQGRRKATFSSALLALASESKSLHGAAVEASHTVPPSPRPSTCRRAHIRYYTSTPTFRISTVTLIPPPTLPLHFTCFFCAILATSAS